MRHLGTAFYCEGPGDARFLGPLLSRVCQDAAASAREVVEVPEVLVLDDAPGRRELARDRRIEHAARDALGAWTVLFIHADADERRPDAARDERVRPAIGGLPT